MIKHRKDSDALLEAFNQIQISEKDHDGDGRVEGPEKEYKDSKDAAIKKAKGEDVKEEATDKTPYDGHDENDEDDKSDEDVKEESVARMPEDEIHMAIGRVNGGDWEGGIERVMAAIGNYIIDGINEDGYGGSPLENSDTAKHWCLRTGIEDAVQDLLGGANASTYDELKQAFKQAFHKGNKKDLSEFFDGEPPMQEIHRNHEEPNIDPYDMIDR